MIEFLFFIGAITLVWYRLRRLPSTMQAVGQKEVSPKLSQITQYADRLYAEKKWVAAEKAYLEALKLDHRNIVAYSHLGIIYSTQKQYADAIECFQIAAQIKPSAMTFQNLGLVYYENRNFIKSIAAMEKAIMFEPSANRYVAVSKASRKLADQSRVVEALEKAAELDPTMRILELLADAYIDAGKKDEATAIRSKLSKMKPAAPEVVKRQGRILALKD
ncbi:MAG: tetratricopeptide repeat protein [Candidatus Saccharibacteria bacterium]